MPPPSPPKPLQPPPYDKFYTWALSHPVPPSALSYFHRTPWTQSLLSHHLFTPIPTPSLLTYPTTSENYFLAKTMAAPSEAPSEAPSGQGTSPGLKQWVMLMHSSFGTRALSDVVPGSEREKVVKGRDVEDCDLLVLLAVGEGLDGFAGRTHGGALVTVLDEVLSLCVEYWRQARLEKDRGLQEGGLASIYTAQLNTRFCQGVASPGTFCVRAWLVARVGRKWFAKGQVCDEGGGVLVEAEGLWIEERVKL